MESNPYLVGDEPTQEVEDEVSPVILVRILAHEFKSCGSMCVPNAYCSADVIAELNSLAYTMVNSGFITTE